jgi:Tfp pilus assembly protein PilE
MKRRSGFTLIELMFVFTSIAILAAITLQAVGAYLVNARIAATQTTISKVQSLINSRAQALDRLTKRKGYLAGTPEYLSLSRGGYSNSLRNTLTMKLLQVKYFPQAFYEVNVQALPKVASPIASNSEILYDFLTEANVLGDSPVGIDAFSSAETKDIDFDGLPEFLDAWGNPLRFYRWPTRLFRSGGQTGPNTVAPITAADVALVQQLFSTLPVSTENLTSDLAHDPDDPLQECLNACPYFEEKFHTPATYHVFLVISAGPDGVLGLFEPEQLRDPETGNLIYGNLAVVKDVQALNDDIISLNIRAGGK